MNLLIALAVVAALFFGCLYYPFKSKARRHDHPVAKKPTKAQILDMKLTKLSEELEESLRGNI